MRRSPTMNLKQPVSATSFARKSIDFKIFLSDFDGTIVSRDILDVLCGISGKEAESHALNEKFIAGGGTGLSTLKKRIDYLRGLTLRDIRAKLDENHYLYPGAHELFAFLRRNGIITVLHSGNIMPVLSYYQEILGVDYVIGTQPRMNNDMIVGIELSDFPAADFKLKGCKRIIDDHAGSAKNVIAMGDAPADLPIFRIAAVSIAVNPKAGIADVVDFVLDTDLRTAIPILERYIRPRAMLAPPESSRRGHNG
jgi:phosphoserine phosphatase